VERNVRGVAPVASVMWDMACDIPPWDLGESDSGSWEEDIWELGVGECSELKEDFRGCIRFLEEIMRGMSSMPLRGSPGAVSFWN